MILIPASTFRSIYRGSRLYIGLLFDYAVLTKVTLQKPTTCQKNTATFVDNKPVHNWLQTTQ